MPNHEYFPTALPRMVIRAFNDFGVSASGLFYKNPNYPNAQLHISPTPSRIKNNELDFIVVWGRATEVPLPRDYMVSRYFGAKALKRYKGKGAQEKVMLDAQGFAGVISEQTDNFPHLTAITADKNGDINRRDFLIPDIHACDLALIETLADIAVGHALTFHQAVRWHPNNNHISMVYYNDDCRRKL